MSLVSTESAPVLAVLVVLGGVAGAAVVAGLVRCMAWVRSKFSPDQARHWRFVFVIVPLLVLGVARDGLGDGPDSSAFLAGAVAGYVGLGAWDFLRWRRRRQ